MKTAHGLEPGSTTFFSSKARAVPVPAKDPQATAAASRNARVAPAGTLRGRLFITDAKVEADMRTAA
ncbi:hypothetical protein GCM10016234_07040 [Tianweitania populi]|uniref:Uncharacterized protein n=1 Tax=Tianweitania populi TaxID=1607949 RepID=A0A8J3GIJ7_9HYPH|nr:hypothetical protein GCM10016234_07040 [Tianweitania populi]